MFNHLSNDSSSSKKNQGANFKNINSEMNRIGIIPFLSGHIFLYGVTSPRLLIHTHRALSTSTPHKSAALVLSISLSLLNLSTLYVPHYRLLAIIPAFLDACHQCSSTNQRTWAARLFTLFHFSCFILTLYFALKHSIALNCNVTSYMNRFI